MTKHDLEASGPRGDRPKRRHFSAEYRLRILAEYDAAPPGEKGAILRREGLYDSSVQLWRKKRDEGALKGVSGGQQAASRRRPSYGPRRRLREKLERENARLQRKLAQTEAALEIMGKWHALLEEMSKSADSENS